MSDFDAVERIRTELLAAVREVRDEQRALRVELTERFVSKDAGEAMRKDIDDLESRITWAFRTALTALFLPVVVLIIGYVIYGAATAPK